MNHLFWTGRDELPLGSLVRLCVDRSSKRSFAQALGQVSYHRIVSYQELD